MTPEERARAVVSYWMRGRPSDGRTALENLIATAIRQAEGDASSVVLGGIQGHLCKKCREAVGGPK